MDPSRTKYLSRKTSGGTMGNISRAASHYKVKAHESPDWMARKKRLDFQNTSQRVLHFQPWEG